MDEHNVFCGFCPACDWEYWAKSGKSANMFTRLHKKKCKKTGRTKQPECTKRAITEEKVFRTAAVARGGDVTSSLQHFSGNKKAAELETKNRKIKKTFNADKLEKLMQVTLTK